MKEQTANSLLRGKHQAAIQGLFSDIAGQPTADQIVGGDGPHASLSPMALLE